MFVVGVVWHTRRRETSYRGKMSKAMGCMLVEDVKSFGGSGRKMIVGVWEGAQKERVGGGFGGNPWGRPEYGGNFPATLLRTHLS